MVSEMGRVANWDTALGYQLYCEGRTDGEIADECKVKTSTITSYRLRRWRKGPDEGRGAPPLIRYRKLLHRRLPRPLWGLAMTRKN